jgi:SAM-dependent methyltransferase
MSTLRTLLGKLMPLIGFRGSKQYWEARYRLGGHSGNGSRGRNAEHKAAVLNNFIARHGTESIIEFGCGDGYQLGMLDCPEYIGVDVSPTVIRTCREKYAVDPGKRFMHLDEYDGSKADLSMSLDVIFHLVEDDVYEDYLDRLFSAGRRFVVIYSTSRDMRETGVPHVRHRDVAADCAQHYPSFRRMVEDESALPPPMAIDRGIPVQFLLYERGPFVEADR